MSARWALALAAGVVFSALLSPPAAGANQPPYFTSTAPTTAAVGVDYLYDANATDPDNDQITYYITYKIDNMNITPDTGVFTWTPTKAGTQIVTIYATDGITTATPQTLTIEVAPAQNRPPEFTGSPVLSALVGQPYTCDMDALDPDGDRVYYSLDVAPRGMMIDQLTGYITWMPGEEFANRTEFVSVVVRDEKGLSNTTAFSIEVKKYQPPINHPPVFTGSDVITATVGQLYYYDINYSDQDNDTLTYSLEQGPPNMKINATTGVLTWTPDAGDEGSTVQVRVRVTDGKENDTHVFTIAVKKRTVYYNEDPARTYSSPDLMCVFTLALAILIIIVAYLVGTRKR
ncbi:MAG: putative Ig domain-containing protein [Thermoplasmatota archaeon]